MPESEDRRLSVALFRHIAVLPLLQGDHASGDQRLLRNHLAIGHCAKLRPSGAIISPSTIYRREWLHRAGRLSQVPICNRLRRIRATRLQPTATTSNGNIFRPVAAMLLPNVSRPRQVAPVGYPDDGPYLVTGPAREFRVYSEQGNHVFLALLTALVSGQSSTLAPDAHCGSTVARTTPEESP